uniref:FAD-binding PCMH-type domain-containing protein n=1 Tax=Chromera velia CCMP2878 TaxID=1169474 RepID=A0A0G4FD61_9ALVE|eukprot:Cvel_16304.t1-p1 / transcript=Cvel_16304.t1 / gene=Cvel_16304 / organism=Chromera_velia_CCMP2878 / gene_product=FAD-linked oxidoreductase DDB_G0289697, putative / transcript_product=FAD-linked oxidoreductase DDB_G0289697, putative / location=Cvel_scaffold1251:25110-26582(+) / protein_length=491 / sequence_SO=supercontig / SO=protein_coding / is_pseudo=false
MFRFCCAQDPRETRPPADPLMGGDRAVASLKADLSPEATILLPGDPAYLTNRNQMWNHDNTHNPAAIVVVRSTKDVQAAVTHCRSNGWEVCVAGGRHSLLCMVHNSVVIDLGKLNEVQVDVENKTVTVGGGTKLGKMDKACDEASNGTLATVAGHNPDTGVGGLTLAGGYGHLCRAFGLTIDNLLEAEVVLASGEVVRASEEENADLFWGLRGGGGNFGIVTRFVFRLHQIPPKLVYTNRVFLPLPCLFNCETAVSQVRAYMEESDDRQMCTAVIPGNGPLVFDTIWVGECAEGWKEVKSLDAAVKSPFFPPVTRAEKPYHSFLQNIVSETLQPPGFYYMRSKLLTSLEEGLALALWGHSRKAPTGSCLLIITTTKGKMNEIPEDATAFAGREGKYLLLVLANWSDQKDRAACVQWARECDGVLAPFVGDQQADYSTAVLEERNTLTTAEEEKKGAAVAGAFGKNLERLRELKRKFDPENIFHLNSNILPA